MSPMLYVILRFSDGKPPLNVSRAVTNLPLAREIELLLAGLVLHVRCAFVQESAPEPEREVRAAVLVPLHQLAGRRRTASPASMVLSSAGLPAGVGGGCCVPVVVCASVASTGPAASKRTAAARNSRGRIVQECVCVIQNRSSTSGTSSGSPPACAV